MHTFEMKDKGGGKKILFYTEDWVAVENVRDVWNILCNFVTRMIQEARTT